MLVGAPDGYAPMKDACTHAVVSVCLATGPTCHALASFQECTSAGLGFEKPWLARHKDFPEGGVTRPKEMPR